MSAAPEPTPAAAPAAFEPLPDRERRNPYYRWLMHLGLPLLLSVGLHVLLFGAAAVKSFVQMALPAIQIGEYEAGLVESPEDRLEDAFQWQAQPTLDAPEVQPIEDLSFTDFSRVDTLTESALEAPGPGDASGGELGLGAGRLSLLGTGSGAGEAGTGGFGAGLGGRGGRLGQAGMWNLRVQANKVAYVVDFSGSIVVAVDDLKRELKRSVAQLRPSQSFNVITFYSDDEKAKADAFAPALQPATEDTRRSFFEWLAKRSPRGATDPLPAMKRALALRPEAVFFFSDGFFEDSVVEEITKANRVAGAQILCFVFDELTLGETGAIPKETDGARRLKRLAERNRGQMKIVTGRDLGRR